jgi:UDP-4-amino-4,6-dideoxy-N-acetyl-beta-L-altrosamine transaminase
MIPYSRQNIDKDDINAVVDVMKSDFLTQGPITPIFEENLKKYCNAKYAVATVNATSALHLACMSIGIGQGDIVWTSTISFVASANCAKYCGAEVDLVDIDPISYNMSIDALSKKLKSAKKKGKLPKAIIPVHLSGQSCNMAEIKKLSTEYGFKIIEDASHAFGGKYLDEPIGSCKYSDITVFSFHPVKIITSAEGGVCLTNDKTLYKKIYDLRSHGIVRNEAIVIKQNQGPWYYEQIDLGYNYRLNDLQAALGINQIKKVNSFVKERHKIAKTYDKLFEKNKNIVTPYQIKESYSSFHLYIIKTSNEGKYNRFNVFERLRSEGFYVNVHYIPIYHHPYYSASFDTKHFPNSEEYYSKAISLPIYPGLKEKQILKVVKTIEKGMNYQNLF